ncbi:hypothetical protein [Ruegeria sp. HKCCD8929]|uniref:c-type cytochrome n=1 Tax=Ruegeria sp. HKCCD8929 TaxID=2683006 RepID=UPI001488815C|nr:hypothetical protein [Ruegeria sp. HKCCD8929]
MRACLIALLALGYTLTEAKAETVAPPDSGYASDAWLESATPWSDEQQRREAEIAAYLNDQDPGRASQYGFAPGHTPALAWNWFDRHPVGFSGVPLVLLQTLLSLDPATEADPDLLPLARIWRQASPVPGENGVFTLDHLGSSPHPADYDNGTAKPAQDRRFSLPNGFVFDPTVQPEEVRRINAKLFVMRQLDLTTLLRSSLRKRIYEDDIDYQTEPEKYQTAPNHDAVFFACSACHTGRVVVGGEIDDSGNMVQQGQVRFLHGMPNTEIEAQHYSELLLATGLALVESGFSMGSQTLPDPDDIEANRDVVKALLVRMIDRARKDDTVGTIYGPSPEEMRRAKLQTYWVAKDFATHIANLIGTAVKTQYIYHQVGKKHAYNANNPQKVTPDQRVPDMMNNRPGQMDAFGVAAGLVALHTKRPDNTYVRFMQDDFPDNPLFTGIATLPGFETPADAEAAGERIFSNVESWAPSVPAPIDIKSLNWSAHRVHANWDGNQGAAARALASGTSATGNPLETNVRIHEPLNPFINNLPPPPYPFEIDKDKARRGIEVYERENCASCHKPHNDKIYPVAELGVDENRSRVTSEVARFGLAGLVMEACRVFMRKYPGNDWCLPRDDDGNVVTETAAAYDDYFRDIPGRVRAGSNGYKADMLHGIWARAPYLHNGSVPTLMHLMCPKTRPAKFKRGNIYYDQAMVGFEWNIVPQQRYSPHDTMSIKDYDTAEFGRSNGGHDFAANLCPDTSGLDPVADRDEIARRVLASEIGDLLEYLKTF